MIHAIHRLGQEILAERGLDVSDPLPIMVENPDARGKLKHLLAIVFDRAGDAVRYARVSHEEYDGARVQEYLYRRGSGGGSNATPTAFLVDPKKTLKNKIQRWFNRAKVPFCVATAEVLKTHFDRVVADLTAARALISKKEATLLTVKFREGGAERYLGAYPVFREALVAFATRRYYTTSKVTSRAENVVCSVCLTRQPEVFGLVQTYNFYNADKPGTLGADFRAKDAWRCHPVCLTCALELETGRAFLDEALTFRFCGIPYKVIPRVVFAHDLGRVLALLEDYRKNPHITAADALTNDDAEVFKAISAVGNYVSFDLLFYSQPKTAVFNVLQHVEEMLPSRLQRIFALKAQLDADPLFRDTPHGKKPLAFSFQVLREFFPHKDRGAFRNFDGYFLDAVHKILTGAPMDRTFLTHALMREIRATFIHEPQFVPLMVLRGTMLVLFLARLGVLNNTNHNHNDNNGDEMAVIEKKTALLQFDLSDPLTAMVQRHFEAFGELFPVPAAKAIFLLGALTKRLLNVQWYDRGKTPFLNKLQNLKMNERIVRGLLPQVHQKLSEYKRRYPRLESLVTRYFHLAGVNWRLSIDDINFYFVMGMNLEYLFRTKKEEKNDEQQHSEE